MTFANVNGDRIVSGTITIPYFGLWHADVSLAEASTLEDPLVLTVGNLVMKGAIVRAASYAGARSVRIVGGAAGWRKVVPSKWYHSAAGVKLSTIFGDVAREVGERVELATDSTVPAFARENKLASFVLGALALPLWYMRPDGVTYVGPRTSKLIATPLTVASFWGDSGKLLVATEDVASFMPGNTFSSPTTKAKTISAAIHMINDGTVRTEVLAA